MRIKKMSVLLLCTGLFLVGCSKNGEKQDSETVKEVNLDDIKSKGKKQTKTVDGKEVEEYIMEDGTTIQMDPEMQNQDAQSE
ncbi:hypothetical protein BHY08_01630 [Vagococcus teuberi]|uniref:Lipoprotein n=2 Tax=Enterococcaceae TaxID=81852 RepID=A0A1J0A8F0_9ENTE|nr:hypothetical protein BHY08_01630 [Vagococcus teuberi]